MNNTPMTLDKVIKHRHNWSFGAINPKNAIAVADAYIEMAKVQKELVGFFDEISLSIGYLKVHGVSIGQQEPSEDGQPQIVSATIEELRFIIDRIGTLSNEALKKAGIK